MLGIFLDTETNGLNLYKHHVLEIAFQIIDMLNGEVKETFVSKVFLSSIDWDSSDKKSLGINGFTYEEVETAPPPPRVGTTIIHIFAKHQIERGKAVFICQNPSFDRAFFSQLISPDTQERLSLPYHWLDLASMHWVRALEKGEFPWDIGCSKDKIAKAYGLAPENRPHRALNGVKHLVECYEALVGFPKKMQTTT